MKKLLPTVTIFVIITVIITGVFYLLSLRKVTFDIQSNVNNVIIYNSNDNEVNRISSSGDISLREGDYYVISEGEHLDTGKIHFTVEKNNKTVTINPSYSEGHLNDLLGNEIKDIEAAISSRYPSLISEYTLERGSLYRHGDWFGGLLAPKVSDIRQQRDPYRVVLHKKDSEWQVIRRPEYILTSSRHSEVPIGVLRQINQIVP